MRSGCTVRWQKAADCDLFLSPPCATVPLMKPQIRGEDLTRLPWDDCIFAVCVCSPEARSAAFNRRAPIKSKNETGGRKNDKRSSSDRCILVELNNGLSLPLWSSCSVWRLCEGEEQLEITSNRPPCSRVWQSNMRKAEKKAQNKRSQSSGREKNFWSRSQKSCRCGRLGEWQRSQDTLLLNHRWWCQGW